MDRWLLVTLLLMVTLPLSVWCDTPAMCLHDDALGDWELSLSTVQSQVREDCSEGSWAPESTLRVTLKEPNVAVAEDGSHGTWTMIYDQGFEIQLNGKSYFAFQYYTVAENGTVTSYCHTTFGGWFHDDPAAPGVAPANWGCYKATQHSSQGGLMQQGVPNSQILTDVEMDDVVLIPDSPSFSRALNQAQSSWKASPKPLLNNLSIRQVLSALKFPESGVGRSYNVSSLGSDVSDLPTSWDWRNVSGVNYDSPIRDQLSCGSCYAFAGTGFFELRDRIRTHGQSELLLSPQNIVSCSPYAQGCDGGFPYLVSKHAQDFGIVTEQCFPYLSGVVSDDVPCSKMCENPTRYRAFDYGYVGDYYGGCSERGMMLEVMKNGPIPVSFEVYPDFMHYTSGVYHHVQDPDHDVTKHGLILTNHVVIIVGWGVEDATGEKYWIVKNSWGHHFGESGFFRIRRGSDECGIESMAERANIMAEVSYAWFK